MGFESVVVGEASNNGEVWVLKLFDTIPGVYQSFSFSFSDLPKLPQIVSPKHFSRVNTGTLR